MAESIFLRVRVEQNHPMQNSLPFSLRLGGIVTPGVISKTKTVSGGLDQAAKNIN